jgi:cysteinyl-tRNA synthetase
MLLMNGTKMSKSDGNYVTPVQLFTGESKHLSKSYSPMVVRFFMLQAHYRSTLDLQDSALLAAEKGYTRLMEAYENLSKIDALDKTPSDTSLVEELKSGVAAIEAEMDDDFNVPKALARMFELVPKINGLVNGQIPLENVDKASIELLKESFATYLFDVFGLKGAAGADNGEADKLDGVMNLVIDLRQGARERKDWGTADKIRDSLGAVKIQVKDGKDGTSWSSN